MKKKSQNAKKQLGFSHIMAIVAIIVVFGAVGTFMIVRSKAASCTQSTFKQGSRGQCVKYIQQMLNYSTVPGMGDPAKLGGKALAADSSFGPATAKAVRNFQGAGSVLIKVDGVVGKQTWQALCSHAGWLSPYRDRYPTMKTAHNAAVAAGCPKSAITYVKG